MIVVLAGGVGAAKFLQGFSRVIEHEDLVVVANTGDDLELFGLHISPDLDTIMYALAGLVDQDRGWGLRDDASNFLSMMNNYGLDTWFRIGDKDLATHVLRTSLLRKGLTLSEVTERLCSALKVGHRILPMTNDPVRTKVETSEGPLDFQEYFVKREFQLDVRGIIFEGSDSARPNPDVLEAIDESRGIVFAPSNPIVSIGCILSIERIRDAIRGSKAKKVAISPLIGGKAIRGPADKMMSGLGLEPSSLGVASIYRDLVNTFIIDDEDRRLEEPIERLGMRVVVANTLMKTLDSKMKLGEIVLGELAE